MFFQVLGEDQNIVEVYRDLSFGNEVAEDVIHHPLKRGGRVREAKEHDGGFKQSTVGAKHCFLFVGFLDSDVVVSPTNVKLCEVFGTSELVDKLQNEGKRVSVFDCHLV